jgi:hypothetical protein
MISINEKDGLILDGTGTGLVIEALMILEEVVEQVSKASDHSKQEILDNIVDILNLKIEKEDLLAESIGLEIMPDDFGVIRKGI